MVDIKGLQKHDVLMALWNASRGVGLSFMHYAPLHEGQARHEVQEREYADNVGRKHIEFDYLNGKVLKVDIGGDEFDERCYDRDNGEGAARRAIDALRAEKSKRGTA